MRNAWEWFSGQTDSKLANPEYGGDYDPLATRRAAEAQQNRLYGAQQGLEGQIQARLEGRTPSVAEMQMQRSARNAQAQIASQAQGARGMNRMLAQREAIGATAQSQSQIAEAGAQLRAQEQAAAVGQMSGLLGQQQQAALQQQSFASAEQQALMNATQQAQMARWQQSMENQRASSQTGGGLLKTGLTVAGGFFGSDIRAKEDIRPLTLIQATPVRPDERLSYEPPPEDKGLLAGLLGGGGGGLMSDRRAKEDIEEQIMRRLAGARGNHEGLAPVAPYRYRYRPEAAAMMGTDRGMRTGVMAQDLERSPYLRGVVVETPAGLALDRDRAVSASLAASAGLDKRMARIEERLAGRAR